MTGSGIAIFNQSEPQTTIAGIFISVLSILIMCFLYREKMKVGKELCSQPIILVANCTKTCFYLSFTLLLSSGIYEIWEIPPIDALGSLGIAWYAMKEGKEAL